MNDPLEWYFDIPVISRTYLTASFVTTAACALDLVSPFSLYYNYGLIWHKGQLWRLGTNFLFFGMFSLDFLFHMRRSRAASPKAKRFDSDSSTRVERRPREFASCNFEQIWSMNAPVPRYFLVRYCRLLEEGEFRGRTLDFLVGKPRGKIVCVERA